MVFRLLQITQILSPYISPWPLAQHALGISAKRETTLEKFFPSIAEQCCALRLFDRSL